jgi:hydroxyethylthiazole kinase-like uncharacterized protein yjeF
MILTPEQVRGLDERTIASGLPAAVLMETAGRAIAQVVLDRRPVGRVVVLAGVGNNGGDGFVAARVLHDHGFTLEVLVTGERGRLTPEAALHLGAMELRGIVPRWNPPEPEVRQALVGAVAVLDALTGIGATQPLREPMRTWAGMLDGKLEALVVAADVPSGLHAGTGEILGACVHCDVVVTMAALKAGLVLGHGPEHWRERVVADIGIPQAWIREQPQAGQVLDRTVAKTLLPARPVAGHKGTFGHLLLVAGSPGKAGAALLAGEAALRSGLGLCTLATRAVVGPERLPDLMVEHAEDLERLLDRKTALAVGPGLGTDALALVRQALAAQVPVVLDADALTILAQHPELKQERWVLTPHPGEMARLLGISVAEVQADRLGAARRAAVQYGAVVVLKGSRTLVVHPDGRWAIALEPNAALGKGGTGDVLTGILGALLAQGLAPWEAARLAVAVHAEAGRQLRQRFGTRAGLASDLVECLAAAWRVLER